MAEYSMVWGGTATGDAAAATYGAPYSDDEFTDMLSFLLTINRATQGVLKTDVTGYTGGLLVTNPAGTTIRMASGVGLVDGKLYLNSANIDFSVVAPGSGSNFYRVVLRKSFAAQTVRAALIGPDVVALPALTQIDGTTWEIPIAGIEITSDSVITISPEQIAIPRIEEGNLVDGAVTASILHDDAVTTDKILDDAVNGDKIADDAVDTEHIADGAVDTAQIADDAVDYAQAGERILKLYARQGGSATDWNTAGSTNYTPTNVIVQMGSVDVTVSAPNFFATQSVSFPVAFSAHPLVFVTRAGAGAGTNVGDLTTVSFQANAGTEEQNFTVRVERDVDDNTSTVTVFWVAIGPE